jgi:hypothetical protein
VADVSRVFRANGSQDANNLPPGHLAGAIDWYAGI